MLVLNHSGIWHFALSIVYHGITLIVRAVDGFLLKTDGAIVELTKLIVVELIYLACENQLSGKFFPMIFQHPLVAVWEFYLVFKEVN